MKRTLLSTLVAGALAAGSMGSASALTFYFDGYGGWVDGSASTNPFPNPTYDGAGVVDGQGATVAGVSNDLIWGTATNGGGDYDGRSYARINDPASLPGNADGDYVRNSTITVSNDQPVLLGTLTHFNEPIAQWWDRTGDVSPEGYENIATASVRYFFDVYSDEAKTDLIASLNSESFGDFDIRFEETHNDGNCELGGTGTGLDCDDIFSFDPAAASDTFVYQGSTYRVTLSGFYDSATLDNLTGEFYSSEGGSNVGFVGVVTHVPEPASVALMGLGLLGLGLARRRKQPLKA